MLEFPKRLTQIREQAGYSVEEFGVLGGVGKATQYNYEKGTRKPDIEYLERLATLGYDILYIVTGKASDSSLNPNEAQLIELYRQTSLPIKQAVMRVLGSDLNED